MVYDPKSEMLKVGYSHKGQTHTATIWLKPPEFEKLDVEISFSDVSKDGAEGIISKGFYARIGWSPKNDLSEKGIFGTKIECSTLRKLGIEDSTYDTTGRNRAKEGGIRCIFDVTHFDENGRFVVEEVKLITSEKGYGHAREEAIGKLIKHSSEWNAIPDEDRKDGDIALPKVHEGRIVIILFDPHTGEFTRTTEWVNIPEKKGGA